MITAWRLLFTIACLSQFAGSAIPGNEQRTAVEPLGAGFIVNVTLSDRAKELLAEKNETVVVAGYVTGVPKKGGLKRYVSEMAEVELGAVRKEILPGESASFGRITLKKDAVEQTDKNDPQLLINVFSGRKSSKDNLLDCGIYEGSLRSVQGRSIEIHCKLIRE